MISIIDFHPLLHTMSMTLISPKTAPKARKIPAITFKESGGVYELSIASIDSSYQHDCKPIEVKSPHGWIWKFCILGDLSWQEESLGFGTVHYVKAASCSVIINKIEKEESGWPCWVRASDCHEQFRFSLDQRYLPANIEIQRCNHLLQSAMTHDVRNATIQCGMVD